ncbi:uncharacterized protein [Physcomitrium patens]|uniref:BHLH domain-containing protein n=2 Tax=Physcomitrium patens TaxID=3218 RepID=A9T4P5_PHYPA|nr:uncharacterized protein LOC112278297 [Physcomitrium patens]XP_024367324.1 uncharacterized protein LOC112278297 [Physcomitrium patens]XP_024367325.1 uncharacterized protein LOC112278297 [Physcomitrium patens]XP_024367326.1 uncharacterized protein LOC112278297 [Physcomitrium patens]PNR26497.1 hypothetical protein PHYPA_031072 [Physcomitrium patens]|eukprot:XP_024367322.1 uncharacterized protein LOC112278297 [Physcomitrella patens]
MVRFNYMYPVQEQLEAMTDQHTPSMDSVSSAGEKTSSCIVQQGGNASETSNLWEEWTQGSNGDDSVSTSNFLPELNSSTSSRLAFHQSDILSTWISGYHPLSQSSLSSEFSHTSDRENHPPAFMQEGLIPSGLILDSDPALTDIYTRSSSSDSLPYPTARIMDKALTDHELESAVPLAYEKGCVPPQVLRNLGPLSPSSPLAFQNGLLNPLRDPWDSCPSALPWSNVTTASQTYGQVTTRTFIPDHSASAIDKLEAVATITAGYGASKPQHTDVFIEPNGTFQSTPAGWAPQFYDGSEATGLLVKPMRAIASLGEAGCGEATSEFCTKTKPGLLKGGDTITSPVGSLLGDCKKAESSMKQVWPGKHRLELVELVDGEDTKSSPTQLKRPKHSTDYANVLLSDHILKGAELRSYFHSGDVGLNASQAMDIIVIGPALNTNGKPRAKRGSATDPQSVYARHRREKINERLKNLQNLVPNGAKVDIVTMLDEAIHYVKFLQTQVELLKSDEFWMFANPHNYNGIDISDPSSMHSPELESNI